MKRRSFQPTTSKSAPPRSTSRGQHIALRLVLIVFVVLFLVVFVPAPWSFHIGGQFTPLGQWDGYGPVRASNGGRYLLFTHLQGGVIGRADRPGCTIHGSCGILRGSAKLCTESGRVYSFSLGGKMHGWLTTDRSPTDIDLSGGSPVPLQHGQVIAFHGVWHGPALPIAATGGSFTEVFTPAGAIRQTTSPADAGTASGTLRSGSAAAFDQACHALAARAQ
jgi:hypothetical protein